MLPPLFSLCSTLAFPSPAWALPRSSLVAGGCSVLRHLRLTDKRLAKLHPPFYSSVFIDEQAASSSPSRLVLCYLASKRILQGWVLLLGCCWTLPQQEPKAADGLRARATSQRQGPSRGAARSPNTRCSDVRGECNMTNR